MDLQLKGNRALVTGSTAGIGLGIARGLAAEGSTVIVNGRTEERVRQTLDRLRGGAGDVTGFAGDLSQSSVSDRLISEHPDLDILVNNLGIYEIKPFEQIDDMAWEHIWQVNFMSGVRLSRHYLPRMKAAGWGRILFISSESATHIPVEMIHYGVTKTAQVSLARGLAETTPGTGVTVNSVLVGPTKSEAVEGFLSDMALKQGQTDTRERVLRDCAAEFTPRAIRNTRGGGKHGGISGKPSGFRNKRGRNTRRRWRSALDLLKRYISQ